MSSATIHETRRRKVEIQRFFVTHAWHRLGILEVDGYMDGERRASNWGLPDLARHEHFSGAVGYSVFLTRSEAIAAVKKKAAAKARDLRRRLAIIDRVAEFGPDGITPAKEPSEVGPDEAPASQARVSP